MLGCGACCGLLRELLLAVGLAQLVGGLVGAGRGAAVAGGDLGRVGVAGCLAGGVKGLASGLGLGNKEGGGCESVWQGQSGVRADRERPNACTLRMEYTVRVGEGDKAKMCCCVYGSVRTTVSVLMHGQLPHEEGNFSRFTRTP